MKANNYNLLRSKLESLRRRAIVENDFKDPRTIMDVNRAVFEEFVLEELALIYKILELNRVLGASGKRYTYYAAMANSDEEE